MKRFILTHDCHLIVEKDGRNIFGMTCKKDMLFYGTMRKSKIQGFDLDLGEGCIIAQLNPGIMKKV
jgi:hypothetical protein